MNTTKPKTPTAPKELGVVGKAKWKQIWTTVERLEPEDALWVEELCVAFDELAYINRWIRENNDKTVYVMRNDSMASHPYVGRQKDLRAFTTQRLQELGLNPLSRAKMGLIAEETNQTMSEYEKRKLERLEKRIKEQEAEFDAAL